MTVSTTTPSIRYNYTGPGDYTFAFRILADTDLILTYIDTDGVSTVLVYGGSTGYTVTTVDGVDGGTCHVLYAETTGFLTIERDTEIVQEVDWQDSGPLSEELLETSFDRDIMIMQEFEERLDNFDSGENASWRGDWVTGTDYVGYDVVIDSGGIYICAVAHTSGVFATDLAAGYWLLQYETGIPAEISRPNLLVNSAFKDNQRAYAANGVASLADGSYGHDMFMAKGGSLIYTEESDGDITINSFTEVGAGTVELWQKNDDIIAADNKMVTYSLNVVSLDLPVELFVEGVSILDITTTGVKYFSALSTGVGSVGIGRTFSGAGTYSPNFRFNSWKVEESPIPTEYLKPEPRAGAARGYYYYRKITFPNIYIICPIVYDTTYSGWRGEVSYELGGMKLGYTKNYPGATPTVVGGTYTVSSIGGTTINQGPLGNQFTVATTGGAPSGGEVAYLRATAGDFIVELDANYYS